MDFQTVRSGKGHLLGADHVGGGKIAGNGIDVADFSGWFDGGGVQHLYRSSTGTVDLAHNPLTLPLQLPACHVVIYVISGSATIKQTIPAMGNIYEDGPLVYGDPAYGPYNGVVWISEQNPCGGSG